MISMPIGPFLIFFFALSVLSHISNHILYRYLYMSAGVTAEDVRTYLWSTAEGNRHAHRSRNRQLWPWLEMRSGHSQEFYTMSRYCNFCNLPAVLYTLAGVGMMVVRLHPYIWVLGAAMIALWAILTLLGVMYGKRIQAETADYFDSSRYHPYQPQRSETDHTSGPYNQTPPTGPFAAADPEEVERRRFRRGYTQKLFVVAVVLVFLVLPMLSSKFLPTTSTPEATTAPTSEAPAPEVSDPPSVLSDFQAMYQRLDKEGFHPLNAVGQLSDTYPGIILSDGILVEEQGLHLEYLVLTQESQAKDLAQGLQHQLYELVAARDPDITEESGEGYTLYTQETEGDYGVVVRDGTNILYVYCPQYDTTWMKWFLNDLGYLSDY